ncbi:inverted formin-2-like [Pyrus ussuriensis x Pyrus communis]|uniref:Inverted formin-2-like n=1 Tax=Pyrus ussuriensis x Pyrus communis TaxID=2448454 RepID=A0A5N5H065_9ROSA|nr:inverted formin-2-like [Pyrus ussuriensis x Pyrus communis]KAB2620173.1 inverted formin-2-like [Pyrus ussuriensis x Pyrus communis]KAB2624141.1 inverted formin-2-like [Pyrus ussuriensis x Pyrus communis]
MADCTGEREKEGYSVEETAAVRNRLSGLHLDSSSFKSSSAADPKNPVKTLKRRSPTQSPPLSQPNPKKEKLSHPPHPPSPLLRRCISDTFCFNPTPPPPQSHPEPTVTVTPPLAPPTGNASAAASASTINPKPKLHRSVSVPNPRSPKTVSGSDEDDNTSVLRD